MFFNDFELPWASIWVPMGSLFATVFSTLFLNVEMVAKMKPKWEDPNEGLSSEVYPPPPLGLSPSLLSLKGTLINETFSVW